LLLLRVRRSGRSRRTVTLPEADIAVLRSPDSETVRPHRRHAAAR
jgi:hypothetical protein